MRQEADRYVNDEWFHVVSNAVLFHVVSQKIMASTKGSSNVQVVAGILSNINPILNC
jgi:hypothetical protein